MAANEIQMLTNGCEKYTTQVIQMSMDWSWKVKPETIKPWPKVEPLLPMGSCNECYLLILCQWWRYWTLVDHVGSQGPRHLRGNWSLEWGNLRQRFLLRITMGLTVRHYRLNMIKHPPWFFLNRFAARNLFQSYVVFFWQFFCGNDLYFCIFWQPQERNWETSAILDICELATIFMV